MFAPDFLPPEIKKYKHYYRYRNRKFKTREAALLRWYRDQAKSNRN